MNCKKCISWLLSVMLLLSLLPGTTAMASAGSEQEIITGHICHFDAIVTEPDCVNQGYTTYICHICEDSFEDEYIPALGHSLDSNGVCTRCNNEIEYSPGDINADGDLMADDLAAVRIVLLGFGDDIEVIDATDCTGDYSTDLRDLIRLKKHLADDTDASGFTYTVSDGKVTITGYNGELKGAVTIPSYIENCPVTAIGDSAFISRTEVTSFLLPSTVTEIGASAFEDCASLISIALPNKIKSIGERAFSKCHKMFSIRLSKNISVLADSVFESCSELSKIELPEKIEEIGKYAFAYCSSLVELNIPEKVTVLNENTFDGCSELIFVGLPETLKEIKCYTFYGCEKLQSVSIPITVVEVGDSAFAECSSLLSVVVPYETRFGFDVFVGCDVLVVKGLYGTGGIDAAVNSGAKYEIMECGHTDYLLLGAINPTCSKEGYSGDKYCIGCGKIDAMGVVLAKTGHTTVLRHDRPVSCEKYGYTGDTYCIACETYLDYGYYKKPTGHYAAVMNGYVAPTCTENGNYGVFDCEYCGEHINNLTIPAKGHETYRANHRYADCANDGYTGDVTCYVCNTVLSYGSVVEKGEHHFELVGYRKATCNSDGYSGDVICYGCHTYLSHGTVTTKDHTPVTDNYKAATCTENGYSGDSTCLDCGAVLNAGEVLPLLGHKSVLINYKEASCTEDGYTGDQICSVCYVMVSPGKTIASTGHKTVLTGRKEATSTEAGYTGDLVCEKCGEVIEKGTVIAAGHAHNMIITDAKEATCSEEGYTGDKQCSDCGYTERGTVIAKTPHSLITSVVPPTCTENGYNLAKCQNCDFEHKSKYVSSKGHSWGELTDAVEPTCTEEGYSGDRVCTVCGLTEEGKVLEALGHDFCDWAIRCMHAEGTDGFAEKHRNCAVCGLEETSTIAEGTGMFDEKYIEGNCVQESICEYTCKYCGFMHVMPVGITGEHNFIKSTVNEPTCEVEGMFEFKCEFCNETFTENVPALGHDTTDTFVRCYHPTAPLIETDRYQDFSDEISQHRYEEYHTCNRCDREFVTRCEMGELIFEVYEFEGNCSAESYKSYDCTFCEYVLKLSYGIALHEYTTETVSSTCTEQGYTKYSCMHCGDSYKDNFEPLAEHDYVSSAYPPTCEESGYEIYTCNTCGYSYNGAALPAMGHSWDLEGRCINCQKECAHEDATTWNDCPTCGRNYCGNCGEVGHYGADCPNIPMGTYCDYCGGYHFMPEECPKWCSYCYTGHNTDEECPRWCIVCAMKHDIPEDCPNWCTHCGILHHTETECMLWCTVCNIRHGAMVECPNWCEVCYVIHYERRDCPNWCEMCQVSHYMREDCPRWCGNCGMPHENDYECALWCYSCGIKHNEPMECPNWCDMCGTQHMDPMECPHMGGMGIYCDMCGMNHMDPMECPNWCHMCGMGFWCDMCGTQHMDPMECPNMGMV